MMLQRFGDEVGSCAWDDTRSCTILAFTCRYYARGMFASDAMTTLASGAAATASAPVPLLDWPLRHISGGNICSGAQAFLKPDSASARPVGDSM
jgi:hypothetical protein